MKKFENIIAISGFVGNDAEIRTFSTASLARFSLAVSRTEKNGDDSIRTSAFMNFEAWRKNENTSDFVLLKKGAMLTVEGFFKPEEWVSEDGAKHNRIVFVATNWHEVEDVEPAEPEQKTTNKKKGK